MKIRPNYRRLIIIAAIFLLGGLTLPEAAARKEYRVAFEKAYPALAVQVKVADCKVCHVPGGPKAVRNAYGQAVHTALGAKNVKDDNQIEAALKLAHDAINPAGVTFGSHIELGELPR